MSAPLPTLAPAGLTAALKQAWRDGAPPDAAGALREFPSLLRRRTLVVDLAYEEYCLREQAGHVPDTESFCRALPAFQSAVREVIRGHRVLADHPELFDRLDVRWPQPGEEVEGCTVARELGRGAFARAFLAIDHETGNQPVVLKLSPTPSVEAKTLGPVRHPHVAEVLWARRADDLSAICLRYVGAATLGDVIGAAFGPAADGPPTARTVLEAVAAAGAGLPDPEPAPPLLRPAQSYADAVATVAARLAGALAHLHATGVTHGDLKPSNIVLGPGGHPYLIDFNLAGGAAESLQRCGGTLPYMAPERIRLVLGLSPSEVGRADRAADVYSFGAVLFEALTGRVPFDPVDDPDLTAVATALLGRVLTGPPALRAGGVPGRLARLVRRCLDPDPARRPTAAALARDLDRFVRRWTRRARVCAAVLTAVALIGAGRAATQPPTPGSPPAGEPAPPRSMTADELVAKGLEQLQSNADVGPAAESFRQAFQLREDGRTAALLGYCRNRTGNHSAALGFYQEAITRGYRETWVHNNLAFTLIQANLNNPRAVRPAVAEAQAAIDRDPSCRTALYIRAWARFMSSVDHGTGALSDPIVVVELDRDLAALLADPPDGFLPYVLAARIQVVAKDADAARLATAVGYVAKAVSLGWPLKSASGDLFTGRLQDREDFQSIREPDLPVRPAADPALMAPPVR